MAKPDPNKHQHDTNGGSGTDSYVNNHGEMVWYRYDLCSCGKEHNVRVTNKAKLD